MSIDEEFAKFIRVDVQDAIGRMDKPTSEILNSKEERCFGDAGDSADSFAKCMLKEEKIFKKASKEFDVKMMFVQRRLFGCLEGAARGGSLNQSAVDECKHRSRQDLAELVDNFFRRVKH
jgi:hypothetical protein